MIQATGRCQCIFGIGKGRPVKAFQEVHVRWPILMVGGTGLEPVTSCVSSKYSNQLS